MLEKSWAKPFAEKIFLKIDESRFACLYSDKASRPNTPVNVCAGALIIKELLNLTDDEMVESLAFDVRFQYALHTTSFEEQPLSDKTLTRKQLTVKKREKQHRGYAANVTESVGEDTSIITDYQLDANTHSDSDFLKEHLESVERTPECNTLVTDGAYSSEANRQAC